MRDQGQIRSDVNLEAVRAAFIGMTEGLLRDQVLAQRSEFRASYSFDDLKKVLGVLLFGASRGSIAAAAEGGQWLSGALPHGNSVPLCRTDAHAQVHRRNRMREGAHRNEAHASFGVGAHILQRDSA